MRQFDVYANSNAKTRAAFPYVVDIQNPALTELATRIVVPLARTASFGRQAMERLTPTISCAGEDLLLLMPQVSSVPAKTLQEPVGTVRHLRDEILAALDFAITGV